MDRETQLRDEGRRLALEVFGVQLADELAGHYAAANERWASSVSADEEATVATVLDRGLDVEAVEFALRLQSRAQPHLLTSKIWILSYLIEAHGSERYVNRRGARILHTATLTSHVLQAGPAWVRGWWLVRRHGLV